MKNDSKTFAPPKKVKYKTKRSREYLTAGEIDQLISSALTGSRNGLRDATLIALCFELALRIGSALELRWTQFDFKQGVLRIKGAKNSTVDRQLGARCKRMLEQLLREEPHGEFVFSVGKSRRLSARSAHLIMAVAGQRANLPVAIHPDMLVKTRCLQLASENKPADEIAEYLGHSSYKAAEDAIRQVQEWRLETAGIVAPYVLLGLNKSKRVWKVRVPASTCNLGPGLDTLGLALTSYVYVEFRTRTRNDTSILKLEGALSRESSVKDQGDLIYNVLRKVWRRTPAMLEEMHVRVSADIALGTGLGISGAVFLGALWASYFFNDQIPSHLGLLKESLAIEGHAETLASSLLGGLVVSGLSSSGEQILTQKIAWPSDWSFLVLVPPYSLVTPKARAVLPTQVSLDDATFNMQRTSLLIASAVNHDAEMLRKVLSSDRLHERYRRKLVPHLEQVRREISNENILGCTLSGAGSSVLVLVQEREKRTVKARLKRWITQMNSGFRLLDLNCDPNGLLQIE